MAIPLRAVMRRGAVTCALDTPIKEVAQIAVVNHIRYVVVTDEQHGVAGIISARSILRAWGKDLEQTTAKDILLPYTITATPDMPLDDAIGIMQKKRIHHLIIVSARPPHKRVVGILRAADVVRYMART